MLEKGDQINLFVAYVEADGAVVNLWSQTDFDAYAELETLMKNVELGRNGVTRVDPESLRVGDVYLAQSSEDGNWYRAQVKEIDKSLGVVNVFFIDFGNRESISFSSVAKGEPKYFAWPSQAARFRLADISPANASGWSQAEADCLKEKLSYGEFSGIVCHAGIVGVDPTVRLFDPETTDSNSLLASSLIRDGTGVSFDNSHLQKTSTDRSLLDVGSEHHVYISYTSSSFDFWVRLSKDEEALDDLHAQLADYLTSPAGNDSCTVGIGEHCLCQYGGTESYYRAVVSNVFKDKSECRVTFIDYGDSEVVSADCIRFLPAEFIDHPPHAIHCSLSGEAVNAVDFDRLIESDTVYIRVKSILHSGTHVVALSEQRPSAAASQPASYSPVQFDVGSCQDVCISHVDDTGHFSVQLLSMAHHLDDLMADLQSTSLVPLKHVAADAPCLVKDSQDGLVYRAKIMSTTASGARVSLVDFGAVNVADGSQLYAITQSLIKLPRQAIPCTLSNVENRPPIDVLNHYMGKTALVAKVIMKTSESCEMDMYDTRDSQDVKISDIVNGNKKLNGATAVVSKQPSLPKLELRSTEKLYVTSIVDDATFFAQLSRIPMATLQNFQDELFGAYTRENVPTLPSPGVGDVCCTCFSVDESFYRGIVQEVSGSKVTVTFIDYGNSEVKETEEVKVLTSEFHDLPPQAVECRLDGYSGLTKENLEAALLEKEVTVSIDTQMKSSYVVSVLPCPENKDVHCVLKSFEPARRPTNDHRGTSNTTMRLSSDMDYKSPSVRPHVWSEVTVTVVDDPEHFTCQLTATEGQLNDMMTDIDEYCRHLQAGEGTPHNVALHTAVIAKFSEDDGWYRARVTGVLASSGKVEVMFVDYGNHEVVAPSALRTMQPRFMTLPMQAVPCCLAGIKGQPRPTWVQDDTDAFSAIVLEDKCQGLFDDSLLEVNGRFTIKLYNGSTCINAKFLASVDKLSRDFDSAGPGGTGASKPHTVTSSGDLEEEAGIRKPRTTSIAATMLKSMSPGGESRQTSVLRFKQPSLPDNQYFDLFVAHCVSPGQFWCQAASSISDLDTMMEKLDAEYSGLGAAELSVGRPVQSEPCCARYSADNSWYRAVIGSVVSDREVLVQFVDYGNEERLSVDGIKQLRKEYFDLAGQAFQCRLASVVPPSGTWSAEASAMFEELTVDVKIVGCIIDKDNAVYTVELNKSNGPVHEELIKAGFAVSTEAPLQRRLSEGSATSRTSSSSRGSTSRSTANESKYKNLQLKTGQFVDVNVSHVVSPVNFWCQLTESSGDLQLVTEQLASAYDGMATSDLELTAPAVGRVCCGRFMEDDLWYRGVIVEMEGERCLVQFVDYGNDEWLPRDRIKQLKSSLMALPTQAVRCTFEGISPCGVAWTEESRLAFEDLTIDKNLLAMLVLRMKDGISKIKLSLVDDTTGKETQIADEMVRLGFAVSAAGGAVKSASPISPPRKPVEPEVTLTAVRVEAGMRHTVAVSWVNSPSDFYCQLEKSADQLSTLAEGMFKFYDRLGGSERPLTKVSVGAVCAAPYPADGNWYRSRVTEIISNSKLIVMYVDYGNTETVETAKVKAIAAEFSKLPTQAICCCLGNVQSPGNKPWSKDAVGQFEGLVSDRLALTSVSECDGVHTVNLTTAGGGNVAEKLSKAIAPPKPEVKKAEPEVRKAPPKPDVVKAAPKYATSYDCAALSSRFRPGEKVEVEVAHVDSLTKFYVQVVADVPQLDDVMNTMETYYAKPENVAEHTDEKYAVGTACVAKFCEDDLWYRAKVTGIAGSKWTVHFVDYGNSEVTDRSRLQPLPLQFAKLAPRALECSLADIGVQGPAAKDEFSTLTVGKRSTATVKTATQTSLTVLLQVDGVDVSAKFKTAAPGGTASDGKYLTPVVPTTDVADVCVTSVVSLAHFYVQLVANEDAVVELSDKITEEYVALPPGDRSVSQLAVDMAVCAMYSIDAAWYRAVVTEVCTDNRVSVLFVDYGNVETVDVGDLRSLTDEYLSVPPLCIRCAMSGVQSGDPEAIEKFTALTEGGEKVLQATFLSSVQPCCVNLSDGDIDISTMFPACETPDVSSKGFTAVTVPSSEADVYVSHVESPGEFYVQLVSREAELDGLVESLVAYADDGCKLGSVAVGQACVACFHDDEAWYRAVVVEVSGSAVTVRYVDFGNSSCVSLADDIKDFIDATHKSPAAFAIQCCLDGIVAPSGGWLDGTKDTLVEMTVDKALGVSFQTSSEPCQLKFTDVDIMNGVKQTLSSSDVAAEPEQVVLPCATQYPDVTVPSDKCEVYVSQVTSPGEFYVQLVSNETALNELLEKVDSLYSGLSETEKTLVEPRAGMPCCAVQDKVWYRAVVHDNTDAGVSVKFVDYGNTETVDAQQVKQLDGVLGRLAPFAFECCFAGLRPTGGWSDDAADQLFNLTDQKVLTVEFLTTDAAPYSVALWDGATNIGDEMSSALPDVVVRTEDKTEEGTMNAEDKTEVAVGEPDKELPTDGAVGFPEVVLPLEERAGFVAAVVTPGDFYVQLSDQETDLAELMVSLAATYDGSETLVLDDPTPGGTCCVRSSADDQWYRATIDTLDNGSATVTFVDCGTSENVATTGLRRVLPEFLLRPPFAIQCHLAGIDNNAEWTQDEMGLFLEKALDKDLTVTLRRDGARRIEAVLIEGTLDVASIFPGRKVLNAIAEELPDDEEEEELPGDAADTEQMKDATPTPSDTDICDLVGHKLDVYISHFVSPTQFWCQLVRSESKLASLSEQLSDDASLDSDWEPSVGASCIARYKDGSLCRARVANVDGDDAVSLFFLDYGNTTCVDRESIYPSKPEWDLVPSYAFQCKLEGMDATSDDSWPEEALRTFTATDKKLLAQFVSADEIGTGLTAAPCYGVHLWDMGLSVRQRLLDSIEVSTEDSFCTAENSAEEEDKSDDAAALVADAVELPRQGKFEVYMSHVKSPSEFWVQQRSSETLLSELSEEMYEYYASRAKSDIRVEVGAFCAVKSVEEERWCRGRVTGIDGDNIDVFYVDHGNADTIDASSVLPLQNKFAVLPAQASSCRLAGVTPGGGEWSDDAIELFTEATSHKCLIADVTGVADDGSYIVNLLDMGMSVAQKMVEAEVAVVVVETSDAAVTLDSSVVDDTESEVRYTCTSLKAGDDLEVHVVSAVSPCNFWCQSAKSSTSQLPLLMDEIQDHYSGSKGDEVGDLVTGMPCVAQLSTDDNWYRAVATSVVDCDDVAVCFVDYGNSEKVARSKVRAVQSRFTELPTQAFKCVLAGVSPLGGVWDTASCNRFQEMVVFEDSKEFRAEVVSVADGQVIEVTLWDGPSSIGQLLVESGYGLDKTESPSDELVSEPTTSATTQGEPLHVLLQRAGYKSPDLCVGTELITMFVSGESPLEFTLNITDSSSDLEALMADIATTGGTVAEKRFVVGEKCLTECDGDIWYRALVTEKRDDGYEVLLVDYGRRVEVSTAAVRSLDESFTELPVPVIVCTLAGLETPEWTDEAMQYFKDECVDKELRARITMPASDNIYGVHLFDASDATAPSINSLLIERGFAVSVGTTKASPSKTEDAEILEKSFLEVDDEEVTADNDVEEVAQLPDVAEVESFRWPDFVVGQEVTVNVLSARDPDNIVCQCVDTTNTFQTLTTQLAVEYAAEKQAIMDKACAGQPCCVRYTKDGTWRRAQVLTVQDEVVEVYHVDYGKKETIAVTAVRDLLPRFLAMPAQSVRCCMHRVEPTSLAWSDDIRDVLEEACCRESRDGEPLPCTITVVSTDGDDRIVVDIESCHGDNVREILRKKKLAVVDGQDPEAFDAIQEEEGGSGQEDQDDLLEDDLLDGKARLDVAAPEYKPRTVKEGHHCSVFLSHCVTPSQFWCQVESDDLQVLMDRMQDFYQDADVEGMPSCLGDGDMCCVLSTEDNLWYRAQVESSYEDVYTVQFVDYGHTETTRLSRVRPLVSMFTSSPPFTVECSLAGVEPHGGGEWSEDAIELLQSLAASPMIMKVVGAPSGDVISVELTPRSQGASVADTLLAEKYAQRPPRTSLPDQAGELQDPPKTSDPEEPLGESTEPGEDGAASIVEKETREAESGSDDEPAGQQDSGNDGEEPRECSDKAATTENSGDVVAETLDVALHGDASCVGTSDAPCSAADDASCSATDTLCSAADASGVDADTPDGAIDTVDGTADTSDGAIDTTDGTADTPDGAIDTTDATADMPDGTVDTPDGAIDTTDGTADTSDGTIDTTADTADTSDGAIDTTGGTVDTSDGNIDTTADTTDTSDGTIDTTADTADTSDGTIDTTGGTADTSDGAIDTTADTADTSDGAIDTTGGTADTSDGTIDTTADTADTSDGAVDTTDGTIDTTADTADTSDGAVDTTDGTIDTTADTADTSDGAVDTTDGTADTSDGTADTSHNTADTTDGAVDTPEGTTDGAVDTTDGKIDTSEDVTDITCTMGDCATAIAKLTNGATDTPCGTTDTPCGAAVLNGKTCEGDV